MTYQKLREYEGEVITVGPLDLVARLTDLVDQSVTPHEATFHVEEVSTSDLPLLRPGAVFYYTVGLRGLPDGNKIVEHFIRFRRLPKDLHHA